MKTAVAVRDRLPLRRRANGKLRARRSVIIKARRGGELVVAPVEGNYYRKGTLLLSTDPRPLEIARDRARAARDEAAFRQRDLLLRLTASLPPEDTALTELARDNVLIQSGLPTAEAALAAADFDLAQTRLPAPFGGRAADVKVQAGQQIAPGEEVCTLIDPGSLEVEFLLLEQEIAGLDEGRRVIVSPVAQPELQLSAVLDIVNPVVGDGGLLRVRARLRATGQRRLYPGMNVAVLLEGRAPELVVVPKESVVLRSGRSVVFVYDEEEGVAKWQYVEVAYENDEAVALGEGVEAGQRVIVAGGAYAGS